MNNNISNEQFIYQILEVKYVKSRGRELSLEPMANQDLYPSNWFSRTDYKNKSEILAQAIELGTLIVDTPKFQEGIEGVRKSR